MTTPNQHNELQQPDQPEPELARGRLMAVDWANGTARLVTPKGESVALCFSVADIDMENRMRKLTTCHVDVWGNHTGSSDVETISIKEISHAWLEPEPPGEPKDGPISEKEWDEYMRVIREGRDGLCGECRRRPAAVYSRAMTTTSALNEYRQAEEL